LREEAGASNTLTGMVAMCLRELVSDDETISNFQERLSRAGYSPAHEDEYAKLRLRVVEEGLFAVKEDFPRVTKTQLVDGVVPPGIEYFEYEINLTGFERLRVAKAPTEAFAF
jgi:hypothetical protein